MDQRPAWRVAIDQIHLANDGPIPINRLKEAGDGHYSPPKAQLATFQQALSQVRVGLAKLRRRTGANHLSGERRLAEAGHLLADQRRWANRLMDGE